MFIVDGDRITLTRGDTLEVALTFFRKQDLFEYNSTSGDTIVFTMFKRYNDNEVLITKTIPWKSQVLKLNPSDTADLKRGTYSYKIKITFADGDVETPIDHAPFILL